MLRLIRSKALKVASAAMMTFSVCGCNHTEAFNGNFTPKFENTYNANDTWLIYWYICGSNLETEAGAATADISEMLKAKLPPNVKVLIQAGGSNQWRNDVIKPGQTNHLLYDNEGLHGLQVTEDTDMGETGTLARFLQYGEENFTADHKVFIFWDHGGGSAFGVCQDERTGHSLSLNDIREAFTSVYNTSKENPPFEILGFDACLMATYDTANTLNGIAKYMVASEEIEPGNGWEYTGWVSTLANNPAMGGDALGQVICDSYYAGCVESQSADSATLSVVDLSKLDILSTAYENFGIEALKLSSQNKNFFSYFSRGANISENYGGNTRESGYFDMVDLANLAENSKTLLPETSQNLINAIDEAVVYKVNGMYRNKGRGISSFYPYDGGNAIFNMYMQQNGAPLIHKCLYYHLIYGKMPAMAEEIINGGYLTPTPTTEPTPAPLPIPQPPQQSQQLFDISQLEDIAIHLDQNNNAYVQLNEAQINILSSVHCDLAYISTDDDLIIFLGTDSNVISDWDKGIFTDNFQATWPMLDGHPVFVEVVEEEATEDGKGYNLYSIPIKLNGVKCNLQIAYDYSTEKYKILGARRGENQGMADKNLIKLKSGDEITTLHYAMSVSGDEEDFTEYEIDTFTVNDNPTFDDEKIGDGEYIYCFEFVTPNNESTYSKFVSFVVSGDEIITNRIQE